MLVATSFWLVTGNRFRMLLFSARDFSAFSSPTLGNEANHELRRPHH
jgi:hypothetical protein